MGKQCKGVLNGLPTFISPCIEGKKSVMETSSLLSKIESVSSYLRAGKRIRFARMLDMVRKMHDYTWQHFKDTFMSARIISVLGSVESNKYQNR